MTGDPLSRCTSRHITCVHEDNQLMFNWYFKDRLLIGLGVTLSETSNWVSVFCCLLPNPQRMVFFDLLLNLSAFVDIISTCKRHQYKVVKAVIHVIFLSKYVLNHSLVSNPSLLSSLDRLITVHAVKKEKTFSGISAHFLMRENPIKMRSCLIMNTPKVGSPCKHATARPPIPALPLMAYIIRQAWWRK